MEYAQWDRKGSFVEKKPCPDLFQAARVLKRGRVTVALRHLQINRLFLLQPSFVRNLTKPDRDQSLSLINGGPTCSQLKHKMGLTDGRRYVIMNTMSGTVIDFSKTDGKTVSGWHSNGGGNQKWKLLQNGSDSSWSFFMSNKGFLGVSDSGLTLIVDPKNRFNWHVYPISDTMPSVFQVYVPNRDPAQTLEMKDGNASDGNPIQVNYDLNCSKFHQWWTFIEA